MNPKDQDYLDNCLSWGRLQGVRDELFTSKRGRVHYGEHHYDESPEVRLVRDEELSHLILSVLDRFTEIFDKEVYQKGLSAYINHKRDTFKEETLTSAVSGESFNIDWSAKLGVGVDLEPFHRTSRIRFLAGLEDNKLEAILFMGKLEEIRQTLLNVIKSCESEEGNILFSF